MRWLHGEHQEGITAGCVAFVVLHPSTDPEAIFADQCEVVSRHWRAGRSLEEISDRTDLPVWNVRRCLAELGLHAESRPRPPEPKNSREKIAALLLRSDRPLSCKEIAERIGVSVHTVKWVLNEFDEFVIASRVRVRGQRAALWQHRQSVRERMVS